MANEGRTTKVCLIRLDKIGDLICTLPVDQIDALKGIETRWVIARGLGFVAANADPGRRFIQLDKMTAFQSFRELIRFLKNEKFTTAVSFQAPWWVSLALWWARIPVRTGVRSQWHSFIFLNHALRQKRSRAEKHEADYNAELLSYALKSPIQAAPFLKLHAPTLPDVHDRVGLADGKFVVVHPGMAGSALNWPQKNYVSLIREMAQRQTVAITGTVADETWLTQVREGLKGQSNIRWLVGELTPTELLSVLKDARLVIAPSTGVAHLAAALGRPVLCFFSPRRVQRPIRWAPRGPHVMVLIPELKPKEDSEKCGPEIMARISVEDALATAGQWLA